jgi:hypothetical protein
MNQHDRAKPPFGVKGIHMPLDVYAFTSGWLTVRTAQ